ncbi:glucose PTS transporter subunit IIA, partial [Enterococcus faecium]|uniref:glucose PTS transporter subunit IIA n=1 Tax=Enterococcus faecium TaxID=1352 RepID=UPI00053549A5
LIVDLNLCNRTHKAMIPYAVSSMSELGAELLYLPASLAHNISEAGACFAVSIKTKDKKLKSTAVSAGISALFGITEPALYGVTILHKRVLYAVMFSSLIGGAFAGIVALQAFALVGPGIASITMFADKADPMNLVWAFAVSGISFVVAFAAALVLYKDKEVVNEVETKMETAVVSDAVLSSPVNGKVISLSEVKDTVFSSGMVGDGVAIIPEEGILVAPEDGEITMVFETKHAIGLKTANGAELLFHIGIDTVQLEGKGFEAFVRSGEKVAKGQKLIAFDIDLIKEAGFDPTVICVVTNKDNYTIRSFNLEKLVTNDSDLLAISPIA